MPSDISITGALRNQIQSLLKGKTNAADSAKNASSAPTPEKASTLFEDDKTTIVSSISDHSKSIEKILDTIEKSLVTLQRARAAVQEIGTYIEEAGGITVQARNAFSQDAKAEDVAAMEKRYTDVLKKIDMIADSFGASGSNILKGDVFITQFSDDSRTDMQTAGFVMTAEGLGFRKADFSSLKSIQDSRIDVINAHDIANAMKNSISSDIMLLQTRQDFSNSTLQALGFASENIPKTNLNDEAAQLLALHVRQQLSTTDAPLAAEAQQHLLSQFL